MIRLLSGLAASKDERSAVVDVGGIGYQVFATTATLSAIKLGQSIKLYTHLAVRDDALDLYGFTAEEELAYFELLLTVPGIGPKSALSVLSLAPPATLRQAIATEDTTYLVDVVGLGRKSAEKIVLSLKDKLTPDDAADARLHPDAEALTALKTLGYSTAEARRALKQLDPEISGTTERIKAALKILGQTQT